MALGIHKAGHIILQVLKRIAAKTKPTWDDQTVATLIQIWDIIEPVIPTTIKIASYRGLRDINKA